MSPYLAGQIAATKCLIILKVSTVMKEVRESNQFKVKVTKDVWLGGEFRESQRAKLKNKWALKLVGCSTL